jgi:PKD repeat protein
MIPSIRTRHAFLTLAVCLPSAALPAASYFPMADADLVRQAPIVARAEVTERTARLDRDGDEDRPFTVVTLRTIELYKGSLEKTFTVVVPGGAVGELKWWVPGAPDFEPGQEVVLMLNALPGRSGEYGLSEFGLSKFDVVADEAGRTFAVRPHFGPDADLFVSRREFPLTAKAMGSPDYPARDGESFLGALRELAAGLPLPDIAYAYPRGEFRRAGPLVREKFGYLGGVELGNCRGQPCMFRWRYEPGGSPDTVVFITGTQSNLSSTYPICGIDQSCLVQDAISKWHGVANTDIRVSGPMPTGIVDARMDLDVAHDGTAWSTPYNCSGGGVAGLGGATSQGTARTYRGLSPYYDLGSGIISMRRWTCTYPTAAFQGIFLHELGHVLGLNHPDQYQSVHSTTNLAQWNAAVMFSGGHYPSVNTPQDDDIQGMQFYYGTQAPGPAPAANFSFSPASPKAGSAVAFSDTSSNSPTGWLWFFGDPSSASNFTRDRNPSHVYAAAGSYTVDLIAGSLNGGSRTSKQVSVAPSGVPSVCTPDTTTLCLNASRFRVTADWEKKDGSKGKGTAVKLTPDTGYFWFFNSSNIEVVTKVLAFCANPFNAYWVFAAGLTNVKTTLTYTDTKNGTVVTKENPQGTAFVPIQDTAAFKTCP